MDPIKMKLLEELLSHLDSSQAMDLKSLLDKSKASADLPPGLDHGDEGDELGKPKGIKVESIQVLGKKPNDQSSDPVQDALDAKGIPSDEDEMSDDELEELLSKIL